MFEELDGFQVLVVTVLVGYPLAVLFAIVQIQHGSHSVHPQTVYMHLFHPEKSVRKQEVLDLRTAVIVDLGTPVGMFALAGILVLVTAGPVKVGKTVGVLGEVGRHPVQDHADLVLVHIVHKVFEILRRAIAGSRCIVTRHLIAPAAVERMLRDPHEFNVGVAHLFYIGCQTFG